MVRLELTEVDEEGLTGNGTTWDGSYERDLDQDDPQAIRSYSFEFGEVEKVVIL